MAEEDRRLGPHLRDLRLARGLTLRDVQSQTEISSGHLSLIETGQVKNPSPTILQRLARTYEVSAEHLLVLAGYLRPKDPKARSSALHGVALAALKDLDEAEIEQVTTLITVLRQRRKRSNR